MTVYKVKTVEGEEEALKILNPNLEFLLERNVLFIEQILDRLKRRHGAKYEVARMILEDVKEWIKRDVNFQNFLEKDRLFREQNDGFTAAGFQYRMVVPRSKGPASRYFMREEYVEGDNLTQWKKLEQEGHDMKQVVSLIVKNYVVQLRRGMVHSDVHVGNFRVTRDKRIAIFDRNFYLELSPDIQDLVNTLLNPVALLTLSSDQLIDKLIKIAGKDIPKRDRAVLAKSWERAKEGILSGDWKRSSNFLVDLRQHGLKLPLEVTLIFKNLNSLQQMSRQAGFNHLVEAYLYAADGGTRQTPDRRLELPQATPLRGRIPAKLLVPAQSP